MEIRESGTSGLKLSVVGFGCWQLGQKGEADYWGTEVNQETANSLVKLAYDSGVTYYDTAEDYAAGESERQLGVALKQLGASRDSYVVGSKILPNHCAKGEVRKYTEAMLERLQIDALDLLMVHWPIDKNSMAHFASHATIDGGGRDYAVSDQSAVPDAPPAEQAFIELAELQKEGKIKHIGTSNFGVTQLKEAMSTGAKISVNQVCYNMIFRGVEFEIVPFCKENGIGIIAYSVLMQGLLTGKYSSADEVPIYRARTRHFDGKRPKSRHGEAGHEKLLFETLAAIKTIAEEVKIPMADLALAWPLHMDNVCCVIAGATKPSQIESNARASKTKIPADVLQKLNDATDALKQAMGKNADLWQGGDDGRIY
eukprot:m.62613 g.62613  ORF g.62613 m.62613 type:complete len:370 (-) comp8101_c0_seq1:3232-4341(-)